MAAEKFNGEKMTSKKAKAILMAVASSTAIGSVERLDPSDMEKSMKLIQMAVDLHEAVDYALEAIDLMDKQLEIEKEE